MKSFELSIIQSVATYEAEAGHNSEMVRGQALKCIATVEAIVKSLEAKRATN